MTPTIARSGLRKSAPHHTSTQFILAADIDGIRDSINLEFRADIEYDVHEDADGMGDMEELVSCHILRGDMEDKLAQSLACALQLYRQEELETYAWERAQQEL